MPERANKEDILGFQVGPVRMIKILTAFAVGAVNGLLVAMMFRSDADLVGSDSSDVQANFDSAPETIAIDTERSPSYEDLMERISELEGQVSALARELQDFRASAPNASSSQPQALSLASSPGTRRSPGLVEQLVGEGFSPERAEWIKTRYDELSAEAKELRWDVNYNLREEIGDNEFERYLRAIGRDPVVLVWGIDQNSLPALAGLRAGDRIVSYDGTRVFDFREIEPLDSQGVSGESVVVDIVREGLPMQIAIPRGTLDVFLYPGAPPLPNPE